MIASLALDRDEPAPVSPAVDWLLPGMLAGVAFLGAIGAIGSFTNVAAAAAEHGWDRPWLLPVGVDGAIAFFTGLDFALVRDGKKVTWIRWFAWAGIAATVGLNVAGKSGLFEVLGHAALPVVFAAAVEAAKATYTARRIITPDRIPLARWLYAPVPTLLIHRRMRLWQVASYAEALEIDTRRVLARCDLIEAHGWKWRWTPGARRQRALYRRGQLAPESDRAPAEAAASPVGSGLPAAKPVERRATSPRKARARRTNPPRTLTDDELAAVAVDLAAADPNVLSGWKPLAGALRATGHGLGTDRARRVLELARATREDSPDA